MADAAEPEIPAELIEAQVDFLREGGPEPDLSGLDAETVTTVLRAFDIVEALVDAGPASPPLANDPVAIRLGLVPPPSGLPGPTTADRADPVTAAMADFEYRFSVTTSPAATDGTAFERRFECRSMVEHVLVVVVPSEIKPASMSSHARGAFSLNQDLSAVAYTNAEANDSVVLTFGECHQMLEPETGWNTEPAELTGEPLAVALGRYLERSDPRWDEVQRLETSDILEGLDADSVNVVDGAMRALAATSPRLEHKREARTFVLDCDSSLFVDWAHRIQHGTATIDEILIELRTQVGANA